MRCRGKKKMSEQEKISILIDYIINKIHSCPLNDESNIDFEKECRIWRSWVRRMYS